MSPGRGKLTPRVRLAIILAVSGPLGMFLADITGLGGPVDAIGLVLGAVLGGAVGFAVGSVGTPRG